MTSTRSSLARIAPLDGIRGSAALLVMAFHFVGSFGQGLPGWVRQASVLGQTGVDLFFVLSGFLITRILLESRGEAQYFGSFYARRVLRIFPLYFGFLALHFFVLPRLLGEPTAEFHQQVWSWTFLENIAQTFPSLGSKGPAHFWSLAVEEHFYLIWPFLVAALPVRRLPAVLLGVIMVSPIARFVLATAGVDVFYLTVTRLDAISFGALLAIIPIRELLSNPVALRIVRVATVGLACLLLAAFSLLSGNGSAALQAIKLSLIPAFYAAAMALCLFDPKAGRIAQLFASRPLRWIGSISFGLYVFHPACFLLVKRYAADPGLPVAFALAFGVTFLVAAISFRWYERPILELKNRLSIRGAVADSAKSIASQNNDPCPPG